MVLSPAPSAGRILRLLAWWRGLISRRTLLAIEGVPSVQIEGRVVAIRPVPLGIARDMVPALIRCARSFSAWEINEALYDDFVIVLSLGLRLPKTSVENFRVPLWQLAPVIERIAQANGMPTVEAGRADLGKLLAAIRSNGMPCSPGSSEQPDGPGKPSSDA